MAKTLRRHHAGIAETALLKNTAPLFHQAWLEAIKPRPLPKMVTAEGDPMIFGKAQYEVLDESALRARS